MSRGERRLPVWRGVADGAEAVEERWLTLSAYTPLGYRGGGGVPNWLRSAVLPLPLEFSRHLASFGFVAFLSLSLLCAELRQLSAVCHEQK